MLNVIVFLRRLGIELRLGWAAIAIAAPLAAPATAQLSFPAATEPASVRETRAIYTRYTECVVSRHPKAAAEVVLSAISNDSVLKSFPDLITPDCLDAGQLTLPGQFIRYGLAEALVRREYSGGIPTDILQAAPLAHPEILEAGRQPRPGKKVSNKEIKRLQERKEQAIAWRVMSEFGECVVRGNPAAALKLVLSASERETQAFGALQSNLAQCLPQNQTVSFARPLLRGTIAVNLYRLAKAPRVTKSAESK
jgi:hypothetical protein